MTKKLFRAKNRTLLPRICRFFFWSTMAITACLGIAAVFIQPDIMRTFLTNTLSQVEKLTGWGLTPSKETVEILVTAAPGAGFGLTVLIGFFAWKARKAHRLATENMKPSSSRIERALIGSDVSCDTTSSSLNPALVGKSVLIADDNSDVVQALSIRLKKLGITPFRSPDATHALLGAQKMTPDLIIMDVVMPSGDGLAVCEMLASDPKYARIPVIVYTGLSDKKTISRCRDVNAYYILKSENAWQEMEPLVSNLLMTSSSNSNENAADEDGESDSDRSSESDGEGILHPGESGSDIILLSIDAEDNVSTSIAKELLPHGVETVHASDLERAYLKCFSKNPDAVLLNSNLPNTTPQEALARLHAHPFLVNTPVFFMGNGLAPEVQEQLAELHTVAFLEKPFDADTLLTQLCNHTDIDESILTKGSEEKTLSPTGSEPAVETSLETSQDMSEEILSEEKLSEEILSEEILSEEILSEEILSEEKLSEEKLSEEIFQDEDDREKPSTYEPVEPFETDETVETVEPPPKPIRSHPKVLCIDDDPDVARSLSVRLRPYGVDVIPAYSGMQGFWTGVDMRPDVVLCDLKMPEGEGTYIFSRLQAHPLTKDVPVIILTGETNAGVKRLMMGMGAAAYLTKPWDFRELVNELGRHIDLRPPAEKAVPAPV